MDSFGIENWIGTPKIAGLDLAKSFDTHLRTYAGDIVDIKIGERAIKVEKAGEEFSIQTSKGIYKAKAVLIATGGVRRKLDAKGAAEFEHKGLTYCASCDGPLFAGQDTVVVGGGNAGFETAAQLLAYAKSVTLVHRSSEFSKADPSTVETVLKHPNMKAVIDSYPVEIKGDGFVSSVVIKNAKTESLSEIPAAGVFVEIGMIPSTDYVKDILPLDTLGRVVIDPKNQRTSVSGIWAAGDCTDELYHQNNIAAGDAVKALEDIYFWLKASK